MCANIFGISHMKIVGHACGSSAIKTRGIFAIASAVTEPNDNQTKEQCIWRWFFWSLKALKSCLCTRKWEARVKLWLYQSKLWIKLTGEFSRASWRTRRLDLHREAHDKRPRQTHKPRYQFLYNTEVSWVCSGFVWSAPCAAPWILVAVIHGVLASVCL